MLLYSPQWLNIGTIMNNSCPELTVRWLTVDQQSTGSWLTLDQHLAKLTVDQWPVLCCSTIDQQSWEESETYNNRQPTVVFTLIAGSNKRLAQKWSIIQCHGTCLSCLQGRLQLSTHEICLVGGFNIVVIESSSSVFKFFFT